VTSRFAGVGAALSVWIVVVLAACSTVDTAAIQYVGVPRYAPTQASAVEILRTEPELAHERLGEIVMDAPVQPGPPVAEIEGRLRSEGAKLGADAVVVKVDRVQPLPGYGYGPWSGWSGDPIAGRKLAGVAIKYR